MEFVEQGKLMSYSLERPNECPQLGLRLDPGRAWAASFDYFAIGVPGKVAIDELAARASRAGRGSRRRVGTDGTPNYGRRRSAVSRGTDDRSANL
jgi:hypothetical protein